MKYALKSYFGIFTILSDLKNKKRKLKDFWSDSPFDITFLALVIILLAIGIVMMFSASYVNAWYSNDTDGDPYYYLKKQALFAVVGLILMFLASHVKIEVFRESSTIVMIIVLLLLVYVLINPHIIPGKEKFKRWIEIPIIGVFQPSELAKLALVMFMAFSMERHQKLIAQKWWIVFPYLGIIGVMCLLIYLENHLSGTLLVLGIGFSMLFFGGIKWQWFAVGAGVLVIAGIFFIANSERFLEGYASERIVTWLKLLKNIELTSEEKVGEGWQSLQSLYAIGSGGLFGLGFGNSRQKHLFLPEPQNDFVFAIVCEELGFIRSMLIIILFVLLVARGFIIAIRAKSKYGAMLALGISFHVGLQAALNMAVVTATVPNTGISLPFFSSGGTALIVLLVEMGIVLAVSRNTERKDKNA